jgi:hypothetical protein
MLGPQAKEAIKHLLRRAGLEHMARTMHATINPVARERRRRERKDLLMLRSGMSAIDRQIAAAAGRSRGVALFVAMSGTRYVLQQVPVIAGVAAHGLEPVVVLPSRGSRDVEELYILCGVRRFAYWDEQRPCPDAADVVAELLLCTSQQQVTALCWRGIAVGKYAVSTLMRRLRSGHIDPKVPTIRAHLEVMLRRSLNHAAASLQLLEQWQPELGVFVDRGYTPEGPFFEACIRYGIRPITFNAAHRDNTLMLKRYGVSNDNVHPSSLSSATWNALRAMTWTEHHWGRLRSQLEYCYCSGQWYGEVGTQFNAQPVDPERLKAELALDPNRKTVLLFPHIFWDATFFWGRDLFGDYEDWFRETVRAAWNNNRVNWIIKVHPANVIKNQRDGVSAEFSEVKVLSEFGEVPPHIHVLPAATKISTLSLFSVADTCLTVRGTVGIEAAMLGLSVVTSGTGRYDRLGFTIDVSGQTEYRELLARIDELPTPTPEQTELARRYAYGVFLLRPLELESVCFRYLHTQGAPLEVTIQPAAEKSLMDCADIREIAQWLESGAEDYIGEESGVGLPVGGDSAV